MKKVFFSTLLLFVMSFVIFILKWEVIKENDGLNMIYFPLFILFVMIVKMKFLGVILVIIIVIGMGWFVTWFAKDGPENLKIIALSIFMLIIGMNVIVSVILLGEQPQKEAIIEAFGGEEDMLEAIKEQMIKENAHIQFTLIDQEIEKDEKYVDENIEYPLLNYNFEVIFTSDEDVDYTGNLHIQAVCHADKIDSCHIVYENAKSLKDANGQDFNVKVEQMRDYLDRVNAEDYEEKQFEIYPIIVE